MESHVLKNNSKQEDFSVSGWVKKAEKLQDETKIGMRKKSQEVETLLNTESQITENSFLNFIRKYSKYFSLSIA